MNQSNKTKFLELMNGLADIYAASLTKEGLQLRFDALKQYTIEQVTEASNIIAQTRKPEKFSTMPGPADFIEALSGNTDDLADIQKSLVMEAINRYNPRQKFKDPITQGVIDKIGWGKIGKVNQKEIPFLLNDFKDMYKSYRKVISNKLLSAPEAFKKIADNSTKRIE